MTQGFKLSEVASAYPWSRTVMDANICQCCWIVDHDQDRGVEGHPCSSCGEPSPGGFSFYPIHAPSLVDLIQEAFCNAENSPKPPVLESRPDIAVVVFFCCLDEALFYHCLRKCAEALGRPSKLIDRFRSDRERRETLFPLLTGVTWSDACQGVKATKTWGIMKRVRSKRNNFIHVGSPWSVPRELATECVDSIPGMISMYERIHNTYVRPLRTI